MDAIRKGENRFFIGEAPEKAIAEITYTPTADGRFIIDRTFVDPSLSGQGIGQKLVEAVIALARAENRKILPHCSFARKVLLNCADCKDLLVSDGEEPLDS